MPDQIAPVQVANTSSPPPQSAVGAAPPSPALNPDEQAGAADLSVMTPDERAGFNDTVQAGIAQSRMNPDEAAGAQDLQAQVDTITKTGKAGDIANFYKDHADVLSSGQTRALGDAYLSPAGKAGISDIWHNTVGMFKQLYDFGGVLSGATTAGEFAGNLTAGESVPQAHKNALLQTGAEVAHGTEALEMQFLQLGKSIVTLGMRAAYEGMKPSLIPPKGGKVPENIEANPANPSTFFKARNGTEEMMDAAGILTQNEKILQGEGFYSQPGSVFAKDTLAKQGITVDPEVSNAVATGGFIGLTSMLSGLKIAGAAAAPTAGRVFIVNEAGDVVAKAATREAATDFIQGTSQWVGEGMSKVGSSISGAMNKVIGATLAGPKKLLEKVTSRFGEGVAGPAVTLAGEHALDMIPHVKTIGLIAGGVAAGLKVTGAGLKLGGNILASEPVSTAVAGTVKGAIKGTVAGAPYAAAGNENDPQAMLTQALTFGVLGGAAGAIHGTAAGISRMSQIAHGEILPKVQPLPNTRVTGNTPNLTKFEDAHQQTMDKLDQFNPLRAALTNAQKDLLQKQGHSWYVFTRQQADSFGLPDAAGEHDAPVTGDDGKPTTINYSVMDNDEVAAGDHEPGHIVADFAQKALPDLWKSLMAAVPGDVRAKLESAYKAASAGNPDIEAAMKTPGYFDKEIGAEILGKYLSDNLRGITDKAPTLASRLNNLVGHVFDKLGMSGNQVGSAAEGATQGFGMVPGMDAAKIAKNIVTKFKTDKQVGTVLEPTKPETPPAPAPAESKFVTPQHEAVVQGLADAVGEKNKSVIKLRGIMEKLRKGESLTPEEADLWKGIHTTAVKAGAPDVTAPVETETPTETPAKPKEPETPVAPETPPAPKNLRVEPEDIKAFSNPAREEANQTLESVNKQVQASPDYTPEQKEAMASFAANPGVMHETAGLSLEPGEKGIADTLRRVAQQNGLDWTKLLVGRNIAPKLARMSERSGAQVQAWSGDRAARNLAQVTGILADAIKAGKLKASDFPWLKPDGTVDPEQMRQGLIQYLKNQDAGARGGGEPLIRPVKGAEKVPAVNPEGEVEPLDADPAKNAAMEKVFNLAMGEKPPKTGRVTEGVEPVQIRAKAIANVNKNAGTLIQPAKTPKQVDVYEYNSLRNKLNKAGVNINQLEPVNTWHNLKDLKGAKATPDIALKPSVQDTTAAGFMPKKPIEITGPDGTKYKAMFDGYQDFTNIGMGRLPQITVNDEAPGFTKNTTTYGPTLEKAGYTLPELPKQELTNGSFMPNKHPMAVKEAAVQNKKTGKIYTGAYHAEANLKYLEETNPGDPSNEARAWGMVENPDSGMIDGFKTNAGEFLNRNQAFDRAVQMGQYVPREAWENARNGLEAVSFNKQQGREGIPEGSRPGYYNSEAYYLPRKSYAEAQKADGINPISAVPGYMPNTPQKETTGWILPDHTWTPTSAGPMGHAENLAHNAPAYTEAFGAGLSGNVNDAERLNAVNKGFVRFRNYAGDLTIETNERHWENQKASVLRRLLDNQDDLHRVDIRIVTDDGKFLSGKGRTLSETQNKEEALKDLVNEVKIPQGTPVSSEPTLIQRARALPGEEGTPAFMPRKPPGNLDQKDLYVIRHGSTPANEDGLTRGWSTVPLSADGKREANEAGIQLGGHGLDRIVTSDLNRAKQTANIISEHTGAPVEVNPGLRSWGFGPKLENKPVEEVHKLLQKLVNNPDTRPEGEYPDGVKPETFNEYKHRIFSTVEGIQNKYPEEKTAIITHYRTMRALEARTKGHEIDVPKFLEKGTDNPAEIKYLKDGKLTTQLPKPGFMPTSEGWKKWTKDSIIVPLDRRDLLDNVTSGKTAVIESLHGTTYNFSVFSAEKGNNGNDWGKANYFSNSPKDIQYNYAGIGPDLADRIDDRAQQIIVQNDWDENNRGQLRRANVLAKKELTEHGGASMRVFVKMKNPLVLGGRSRTYWDAEVDPDLRIERGQAWDFVKSVNEVRKNFDDTRPFNLDEKFMDGGNADEMLKAARESESLMYATDPDEGEMSIGELLRQAVEKMGYDGIIDREVSAKFGPRDVPILGSSLHNPGMKGVSPDTAHIIAFSAEQVKSATGNRGTFDPENPDVRFMPRVKNPKAKPPELSEFDDEKKIKAAFEKPNWAIVTGTRESDGPANSEKNQRANDRLEGELFGSRLDYKVIQGSYKGVDQGKSFLITGITPAEALKIGREYGQESVLVPQGLLYNDGTLNPIDSAKNKFGTDAEKEDFYSKTEEGPAFSAGINFDKRIPTDLGTVNREQAEMFGRSSPKIGSEVVRAKEHHDRKAAFLKKQTANEPTI